MKGAMHTVLTILGASLAIPVGLAVVLLLVPVHLHARGCLADERLDAVASASWVFGTVLARLTPQEGLVIRALGLPVYRYHERIHEAERPTRATRASVVRWSPRKVGRLLTRTLVSLRLRVKVAGRLGIGDPADTAVLFGGLAATRQLFPGLDTRGLAVDWIEPALDLGGSIEGWLWPVERDPLDRARRDPVQPR
jgi:hypothetical protein